MPSRHATLLDQGESFASTNTTSLEFTDITSSLKEYI